MNDPEPNHPEQECPYCGQKYRFSHMIIIEIEDGRKFETCSQVVADFLARNVPSKWIDPKAE